MYDSLELSHTSTVDRVAEALRQALFAGDLSPGTYLREVGLAESLGVGRSTVREALGVLTAEGLATRLPNRGVIVTEHDPDEVHDVVRARLALETAGVRAWPTAAESLRQDVRDAVADYQAVAERPGVTVRDLSAAHLAVHISLVGLVGSTRLVHAAESLAAEIRLALARVDRVRGNIADQVAAHLALLDALEAGDVEEVARDLEQHLAHAESSIRHAVTQHGEPARS